MVKHIVMWKLKSENRLENARIIQSKLMSLAGKVPEILTCEVGIDESGDGGNYDAVLVSTFEDFAALERYKTNPLHLAVSEFVKSVRTDRKAVDFLI